MAGNNLFRSMLLQIVKVINFGYCKGVSESIFPQKNKIKKITLCSASFIQLLLYLRCMYWELSSHCWSFAGEFFCIAVILASSSFLTYHTQAAAALKEKILCFFFLKQNRGLFPCLSFICMCLQLRLNTVERSYV